MTENTTRSKLSLKRESRDTPALAERVHKVLAQAGLGSRRMLEERIEKGEVRVNGAVTDLGTSVHAGDRVEIDGKAFVVVAVEPEENEVLIYHKPDGEVTTHDDPEGRRTVFERMPRNKGSRWISVGRLDINTTGLLLITTDGELAHAMTHPSREVEREYLCRIHGEVTDEALERLRAGVELDDGPAHFDEIAEISRGDSHSWFRVVIKEGRQREVRRLWEAVGLQVSRLKRIRFGSIELPRHLRRGHFEAMPADQVKALRAAVGLSEIPQVLTLQPVIGVRKATKSSVYKPGEKGRSWSGAHADESRELRAFDRIRDDGPGKRGKPRKSGAGRGPKRPAAAHESRLFPSDGATVGADVPRNRGPRRGPPRSGPPGAGGGQERGNERRGAGRPGGRGGPGGQARGPGGQARGPGGPGRGAGGPGRGPGGPGRGAGGGFRGDAPGGNRPRRGGEGPRSGAPGQARIFFPSDSNRPRDDDSRGNYAPRGNDRGNRGNALPYGFPSDHTYARRDEVPNVDPRGPRRGGPRRGPK